MNKVDLFDMVENKETVVEESEDALRERLKKLCYSMKEHNIAKKDVETKLDAEKTEFKKIVEKLGIDCWQDEFVKVSMTTVEKVDFEEDKTIQYLKDNNLTEYIHTKEFFDYSELAMAATQNKLKLEELAPFAHSSKQTRINIR